MVCTRRKTTAPPRLPDLACHPSEEELITSFLRPRVVSGDRTACTFIHDADIYAATPTELTGGFDPAVASNGDRAWYFFSAVRAKTRDGQRKARTVDTGEGCWHSEAGAKPVVGDNGRRLGQRQSFSFVTKLDGRRVRSGWLMVELSLGDADGDVGGGMALCKIYFSPRARVDGGSTAAAAAAASSSAGRSNNKRKAAADDDKSPAASAARQRGVSGGRRPGNEAAGEPHDDDVATADAEGRRGGHAGESSAADGGPGALWTDDDSSFSRWMRDRDRWAKEYNIVDRPDAEIQKDYGIDLYLRLLDHKYDD
ncbi:hypothetical protein U9M48_018097 [Paspalum notatum var. saurae]|uniref:NAC domain-containing protein n=1 Tax=Paspalum notatum var. saurae TaxID=547442 RepID=A0AAQ3T9Y0_PASNO